MIDIYKASAGSGKTFTLAYEYIKMLLGHKRPGGDKYRLDTRTSRRHRSILAITFTNKATSEMKQRIIHELAVLAGDEPGWTKKSDYIDRLCRDLDATPEQIRAEAHRALSELLFDYGFFGVSTIDKFFQQVLRTFAREADLTGNYDLELDGDSLIDMALAGLFRSIEYGNDEATRLTTSRLSEFLRSRMHRGETIELFNRRSTLFGELHSFVKTVLNETFALNSVAIGEYLADSEKISRLAREIEARLTAADERVRTLCSRAAELIGDRQGIDKRKSQAFVKYKAVGLDDDKLGKTLPSLADDPASILTKSGKALLGDSELLGAIGEAAQATVDGYRIKGDLKPLRNNIHFLGLLSDILRNMEQVRQENNLLLLSDTNSILDKIIGEDETPFLYERMGVWLENFLIDEFQDTSLMQWKNLRPLIAEGLATDRDSLIIGDEKQCIYRFRSSDPTLLQHKLQDQFAEAASVRGSAPSENTNWRSSATMVGFNNSFFAAAASIVDASAIYSNVEQAVSPRHSDHTGYVSIVKAEGSTDEATEAGYSRMADEIARQIASGYKPSEIAILGRNAKHLTGAIDYLLKRRETDPEYPHFRIISDDSINVGSNRSVRLVISVLRSMLLSRPDDAASQATEEKRSHSRTLEDVVLARLVNDYEKGCAVGLTPSQALAEAVASSRTYRSDSQEQPEVVPDITADMACPNLQSLVDRVIAAYIDDEALADDNLFITALQDIVAEYASRGGADLKGFLDWWDSKGSTTAVASPESDDAVRFLTIHKAKGLEFKCVHIPVGNYETVKLKGLEWFEVPDQLAGIDPELLPPLFPMKPRGLQGTAFDDQYNRRVSEIKLDETNVMYVAFTRAIDELIVTYGTNGKDKGENYSGSLIEKTLGMLGSPDGNYTVGEPTTRRNTEPKAKTAVEPTGTVEIHPIRPNDRASSWARTELDIPVDPLSPRGRGVIIHNVLAEIGDMADLPRAIRRMVSSGVVPPAMVGEVTAILERELERPEVKPWFSGFSRYIVERPIAVGDGLERRRPDRVVWTADGHIDIIDYKSGEERKTAHSNQVRFYMSQLRRMGYKKVRGFLWYLDTGDIEPVSPRR